MTAWNEYKIASAIALQTLSRKCVVLVDNCSFTGHECDVLAVTTDLRIIDVEVKISRADLRADVKKDKWWIRRFDWRLAEQPAPIPRPWPPKVWKHYYALPKDIWTDELLTVLPQNSGVLLMWETRDGEIRIGCERYAKPCRDATRIDAEQVMDIARLANLRMWGAYQDRDRHAADARFLRQSVNEKCA